MGTQIMKNVFGIVLLLACVYIIVRYFQIALYNCYPRMWESALKFDWYKSFQMNVANANSAEETNTPGAVGKNEDQKNADHQKCPEGSGE